MQKSTTWPQNPHQLIKILHKNGPTVNKTKRKQHSRASVNIPNGAKLSHLVTLVQIKINVFDEKNINAENQHRISDSGKSRRPLGKPNKKQYDMFVAVLPDRRLMFLCPLATNNQHNQNMNIYTSRYSCFRCFNNVGTDEDEKVASVSVQ